MVARGPLDAYLAERTRLIAAATPGSAATRELSDLTDEAIAARAAMASSRVDAAYALFALGGYGARRLLPGSDIDLLIVSKGTKADLDPLVREVLYPLWDAGLAVGHQVRSPAAQLAAVREDVQNATGFMTARYLGGDEAMAQSVVTDTFRRMRKDARGLVRQLVARERPGSPYLLEPDLKDGAGGQRDLDEMTWHSVLRTGDAHAGPGALMSEGLLTEAEVQHLNEAQEAITAARWLMHRADPRGRNLLTLDAAELDGLDAQLVQVALARVHHTLLDLRGRLSGARSASGHESALEDLRSLAEGGAEAIEAAERAAHRGLFDIAIPEFSALMTLRRPALSHHYTVGAHSLRAVAAVGPCLDALGNDRVAPAMRDAALVAALAHDVGKRDAGPDHAARGAEPAAAAAATLGLDAGHAAATGTLVREHLMLAGLTAHTDPADEDAVLAAAARLGDPHLIAPLYALTEADMRSTGPEVWTSWRAAVLGDFAAKLEDALSPDVNGAGIVAAAEATRSAALRAASSVGASRAVLSFVEHAPLRYLARRTTDDVLRDARLVQSLAGPGAPGRFTFSVSVGPADGTWLVDVVTRDRPGLFASLSGALALVGLAALSAEAFCDRSGIALDTFVVSSATRALVGSETWNSFDRILTGVLAGSFDLETRLAERRRHYPSDPTTCPIASVEIGARGMFTTRVRVRTADRVGLLHDLARAIASQGLDIRRAVITTVRGVASDVFEVTDIEGAPPEPGLLLRELTPCLQAAARA